MPDQFGFSNSTVGERLTPLPDFGVGVLRAVVKRAKPLIPRQFKRAIVTLKITVVHLVVESTKPEAGLVFDNHAFKTAVRRGRR